MKEGRTKFAGILQIAMKIPISSEAPNWSRNRIARHIVKSLWHEMSENKMVEIDKMTKGDAHQLVMLAEMTNADVFNLSRDPHWINDLSKRVWGADDWELWGRKEDSTRYVHYWVDKYNSMGADAVIGR